MLKKYQKYEEYSVNLDVQAVPELFEMFLKFMPVGKMFNLVNTCTALHSKLSFPALCYIVERNHNFVPICDEATLLKTAETFYKINNFARMVFLISPSTNISHDGVFYTINIARLKKEITPQTNFGHCTRKWKVSTSRLAYIGRDGSSNISEEADGSVISATSWGNGLAMQNYLLKTPCYRVEEWRSGAVALT